MRLGLILRGFWCYPTLLVGVGFLGGCGGFFTLFV